MSGAARTSRVSPFDVATLPDDPELLKAMVVELATSNEELAKRMAALERILFGPRSERVVDPDDERGGDQPSLFDQDPREEPEVDDEGGDPGDADEGGGPGDADEGSDDRGGDRPGDREAPPKIRRTLEKGTVPPDTPVQHIHCRLEGTGCGVCDEPLQVIGTDVQRRLDWVPGHFEIIEVVQEKGVCPEHREAGIVTAAGPTFALPRSIAGDRLVAKVLVDKFLDNVPLNRQSRRFLRKKARIPVSTLSRWVKSAADLLRHVVKAIRAELLASPWLQGDTTGLPILVGTKRHAHRGCLWVYANESAALFEATLSHGGHHAEAFLKDFEGVWLSDGTSTYNAGVRTGGIKRAGCWSHARRLLFEARTESPEVMRVLAFIRLLFLRERNAKLLSLDEKKAFRREHCAPLIDKIRGWLEQHCSGVRPKSGLGRAKTYLDRQWPTLITFLDHPEIEIHNNRSERLLRQPVTGRKNWLFAGSPDGARAAATIFSVISSCALCGVDPEAYLVDVLPRLNDATPSELAELTPARWADRYFAEILAQEG